MLPRRDRLSASLSNSSKSGEKGFRGRGENTKKMPSRGGVSKYSFLREVRNEAVPSEALEDGRSALQQITVSVRARRGMRTTQGTIK